ncbi:hypothetical protein AKJ29_13065 [Aliiroseovarius crassostreae]|uniref:Uncharacterized protein n=1 Tax=Aliiroseovarius crassostreae TaxID=154981 RepID=A0A0P7II90_9RHOB|nr:hypothetical protein AKJ29_13065 [Aliiroseovarius crassostreae]
MPSAWVVKTVDVLEQRQFVLPANVPGLRPGQLGPQCFEAGLKGSVVIAISLAAHRDLEAALFQRLLVLMRTILAAAVGVMDAAFRGGRLIAVNGILQAGRRAGAG